MTTPTMTIDYYGTKIWKLNGKLHREDGPAIEWADGRKEWWINDTQVDELVFWVTTKERMKEVV